MKEKNKQAQSLANLRWAKTTKAERLEVGKKLSLARKNKKKK